MGVGKLEMALTLFACIGKCPGYRIPLSHSNPSVDSVVHEHWGAC